MQFRTPHCASALRFDQIHDGIEVVILEVCAVGVEIKAAGHTVAAPYASSGWYRGFDVEIREYFSRAYRTVYSAQGLGLLPTIKKLGWCTHLTQEHLDQGIYTPIEVHKGQDCPNFYREATWSNTFVVKLKDAHRVLGCKPWETRQLVMDTLHELRELQDLLDGLDAEFEARALEESKKEEGDLA